MSRYTILNNIFLCSKYFMLSSLSICNYLPILTLPDLPPRLSLFPPFPFFSDSYSTHTPFLNSFFVLSWCAMRSYWPHLGVGTPFEAMTAHSPFIRRSPSWGFLGFSSAVRQMPGDLCTDPRIISLSPLSLATDVTNVTLGASGLWLGTRTGASGTATLT